MQFNEGHEPWTPFVVLADNWLSLPDARAPFPAQLRVGGQDGCSAAAAPTGDEPGWSTRRPQSSPSPSLPLPCNCISRSCIPPVSIRRFRRPVLFPCTAGRGVDRRTGPGVRPGLVVRWTARYWARVIWSFGHQVKLIAPQFLKPYLKGQKNDACDVAAICEAVGRPEMRFVPQKSVGQQDLQALRRDSQPAGRKPHAAR